MTARENQSQQAFYLLFFWIVFRAFGTFQLATMKPVNQTDRIAELELVPVQECVKPD